jgi:hypothetical protein
MRKPPPVWSIPFLLALVGITAFIGRLDADVLVVICLEIVAFSVYLVILGRREPSDPRPLSSLLSLMPGHLLVLMMIALLDRPGLLAWLWTLIPAATVAYDMVGRHAGFTTKARLSISAILYVILWADLFFLIERVVVLHRQSPGNQEIVIAVAMGLAGALFLSLGVYRHRIAAKE